MLFIKEEFGVVYTQHLVMYCVCCYSALCHKNNVSNDEI